MEVIKEVIHELDFNKESSFKATLVNGVITNLHFKPLGDSEGLRSKDIKYLRDVHSSLTELFAFIEAENSANRISYAVVETPVKPVQ